MFHSFYELTRFFFFHLIFFYLFFFSGIHPSPLLSSSLRQEQFPFACRLVWLCVSHFIIYLHTSFCTYQKHINLPITPKLSPAAHLLRFLLSRYVYESSSSSSINSALPRILVSVQFATPIACTLPLPSHHWEREHLALSISINDAFS